MSFSAVAEALRVLQDSVHCWQAHNCPGHTGHSETRPRTVRRWQQHLEVCVCQWWCNSVSMATDHHVYASLLAGGHMTWFPSANTSVHVVESWIYVIMLSSYRLASYPGSFEKSEKRAWYPSKTMHAQLALGFYIWDGKSQSFIQLSTGIVILNLVSLVRSKVES